MPSRIEQALDELARVESDLSPAPWTTTRADGSCLLIQTPEIPLPAARANANTAAVASTRNALPAILTALRAAAAFQESWDRCITIKDLDALTVTNLGRALDALAASVLGEEVPT